MAALLDKLRGKDEIPTGTSCLVAKSDAPQSGGILKKSETPSTKITFNDKATEAYKEYSPVSLKFAPMPEGKPKRSNSFTLGVASRSAMLSKRNESPSTVHTAIPEADPYTVHDVLPAAKSAWNRFRSGSRSRSSERRTDSPSRRAGTPPAVIEEQTMEATLPNSRGRERRNSVDSDSDLPIQKALPRKEVLGFSSSSSERRGRERQRSSHGAANETPQYASEPTQHARADRDTSVDSVDSQVLKRPTSTGGGVEEMSRRN